MALNSDGVMLLAPGMLWGMLRERPVPLEALEVFEPDACCRLGLWRRRTGRLHPDSSRSRTGLVKRNACFTSQRWSRSCHGGAPFLCSGRANLRGHSGHRFLRASWFHRLFCQSTGLFLPKEMLKETTAVI